MTSITLDHVSIDYPIYDLESKYLRQNILHACSFGWLGKKNASIRVEVHALKNISFAIRDGERVGVIGLNGAGKTTLLQTIAGIYSPSSGTLTVEGKINALYNIGLGFDTNATGYENIMLRCLFMGMSKAQAAALIPAVEEFTELGDFLNLPIRTYSAGMQLKLAFAIATSIHPEILIMDEWIGAGDQAFQEKAKKRLQDVVDASSVLLLASHSEALIKDNCSKCLLLHKGEVVSFSDTDTAFAEYKKLMHLGQH